MRFFRVIFILMGFAAAAANNRIYALENAKFCLETSESRCGGTDVVEFQGDGTLMYKLPHLGDESTEMTDPSSLLANPEKMKSAKQSMIKKAEDNTKKIVYTDLEYCEGTMSMLRYPKSELAAYSRTLDKLRVRRVWYCYPDNYAAGRKGAEELLEEYAKLLDIEDENFDNGDIVYNTDIENPVNTIINEPTTLHRLYLSDKSHSFYSYNKPFGVFTGDGWREFYGWHKHKMSLKAPDDEELEGKWEANVQANIGNALSKAWFFTPCRKFNERNDIDNNCPRQFQMFLNETGIEGSAYMIVPAMLFSNAELEGFIEAMPNLKIFVTGQFETISAAPHLKGIDPITYSVEKAILKKRTSNMKKVWFNEFNSYTEKQNSCSEQWSHEDNNYVSGVLDKGNYESCENCAPWLRGQQSAVTTPADFCAFNQKGWFYVNKDSQGMIGNTKDHSTARWANSYWGYYKDDDDLVVESDPLVRSAPYNRQLEQTWRSKLTDSCRSCVPYMECRCWYWSGAMYEHNRHNRARSSAWYPSRHFTGNVYGIAHAAFSHWDEGEDYDKKAHWTEPSDIYNTDRSRYEEYHLNKTFTGNGDQKFARKTIATELEEWRTAMTHIGRENSFRSHRGLLDILITSNSVRYGQGYAVAAKALSGYDKFWRAAEELCAKGNVQTAPGWCNFVEYDWSMSSLTPWVFDPTKVMVDYSIVNMLLELDQRIEMTIDALLKDEVWTELDASIGSFVNRTRYEKMGSFTDMLTQNKLLERSIMTQVKSKKWVDDHKDFNRFENRFFWSFTEEQANNKERSHVAEAIYANSAISQGVEKGERITQYIDCGICGIKRPATYTETNTATGNEDTKFCECILRVGKATSKIFPPKNWDTPHPTRDGEWYNGYFGAAVDDGAFSNVVKNKGFWNIQKTLGTATEYKVEHSLKKYETYEYRTLYEALFDNTYLKEICKPRQDDQSSEDDQSMRPVCTYGADAVAGVESVGVEVAHIEMTRDDPSADLENGGDAFNNLFRYKYFNHYDSGSAENIEIEKSLLETFVHASYMNSISKTPFNIVNARKALEMFELSTNIKNQELGTSDYESALRRASIDETDVEYMEKNFAIEPATLQMSDGDSPAELFHPGEQWASEFTVQQRGLLLGTYELFNDVTGRRLAMNHNNLAFPVFSEGTVESVKKSAELIKHENECELKCRSEDATEECFGNCVSSRVTAKGHTDILRKALELFNYFALGETGETYNEVTGSWMSQICDWWTKTGAPGMAVDDDDIDGLLPALRFRFMKKDETGISITIPLPKPGFAVNYKRGTWFDTGIYFGTNRRKGDKAQHVCGYNTGQGSWWSLGISKTKEVASFGFLTAKLFGFQLGIAMKKMENPFEPWNWVFDDNVKNFAHNVNVNTVSVQLSIDKAPGSGGPLFPLLQMLGLVAGEGIQINVGVGFSYPRPRVVDFPDWQENCRQWIDNQDKGESAGRDAAAAVLDADQRERERDRLCGRHRPIMATSGCNSHKTAADRTSCFNRKLIKYEDCRNTFRNETQKQNMSLALAFGIAASSPIGLISVLATDENARHALGEVVTEGLKMGGETAVNSLMGNIPETDGVIPSFFQPPGKEYQDEFYKCDEKCEEKCRHMDYWLTRPKFQDYCGVAYTFLKEKNAEYVKYIDENGEVAVDGPLTQEEVCKKCDYFLPGAAQDFCKAPVKDYAGNRWGSLHYDDTTSVEFQKNVITRFQYTNNYCNRCGRYKECRCRVCGRDAGSVAGFRGWSDWNKNGNEGDYEYVSWANDRASMSIWDTFGHIPEWVYAATMAASCPHNVPVCAFATSTRVAVMGAREDIKDMYARNWVDDSMRSSNMPFMTADPMNTRQFDHCYPGESINSQDAVFMMIEVTIGTQSVDSIASQVSSSVQAVATTAKYKMMSKAAKMALDQIDGEAEDLARDEKKFRDITAKKELQDFENLAYSNFGQINLVPGGLTEPGNPYWQISEETIVAPVFTNMTLVNEIGLGEAFEVKSFSEWYYSENWFEIYRSNSEQKTLTKAGIGQQFKISIDQRPGLDVSEQDFMIVSRNMAKFYEARMNTIEEDASVVSGYVPASRLAKKDNAYRTGQLVNVPIVYSGTIVIGHTATATHYKNHNTSVAIAFPSSIKITSDTKVLPILSPSNPDNEIAFAIGDTIYFGKLSHSSEDFDTTVDSKFELKEPSIQNGDGGKINLPFTSFTVPMDKDVDERPVAPIFADESGDNIPDLVYLNAESDIRFCKFSTTINTWDCAWENKKLIYDNVPGIDKRYAYIAKDTTSSLCRYALASYEGTISCLSRTIDRIVQSGELTLSDAEQVLQNASSRATFDLPVLSWEMYDDNFEGSYAPKFEFDNSGKTGGCATKGKKCGGKLRTLFKMKHRLWHHAEIKKRALENALETYRANQESGMKGEAEDLARYRREYKVEQEVARFNKVTEARDVQKKIENIELEIKRTADPRKKQELRKQLDEEKSQKQTAASEQFEYQPVITERAFEEYQRLLTEKPDMSKLDIYNNLINNGLIDKKLWKNFLETNAKYSTGAGIEIDSSKSVKQNVGMMTNNIDGESGAENFYKAFQIQKRGGSLIMDASDKAQHMEKVVERTRKDVNKLAPKLIKVKSKPKIRTVVINGLLNQPKLPKVNVQPDLPKNEVDLYDYESQDARNDQKIIQEMNTIRQDYDASNNVRKSFEDIDKEIRDLQGEIDNIDQTLEPERHSALAEANVVLRKAVREQEDYDKKLLEGFGYPAVPVIDPFGNILKCKLPCLPDVEPIQHLSPGDAGYDSAMPLYQEPLLDHDKKPIMDDDGYVTYRETTSLSAIKKTYRDANGNTVQIPFKMWDKTGEKFVARATGDVNKIRAKKRGLAVAVKSAAAKKKPFIKYSKEYKEWVFHKKQSLQETIITQQHNRARMIAQQQTQFPNWEPGAKHMLNDLQRYTNLAAQLTDKEAKKHSFQFKQLGIFHDILEKKRAIKMDKIIASSKFPDIAHDSAVATVIAQEWLRENNYHFKPVAVDKDALKIVFKTQAERERYKEALGKIAEYEMSHSQLYAIAGQGAHTRENDLAYLNDLAKEKAEKMHLPSKSEIEARVQREAEAMVRQVHEIETRKRANELHQTDRASRNKEHVKAVVRYNANCGSSRGRRLNGPSCTLKDRREYLQHQEALDMLKDRAPDNQYDYLDGLNTFELEDMGLMKMANGDVISMTDDGSTWGIKEGRLVDDYAVSRQQSVQDAYDKGKPFQTAFDNVMATSAASATSAAYAERAAAVERVTNLQVASQLARSLRGADGTYAADAAELLQRISSEPTAEEGGLDSLTLILKDVDGVTVDGKRLTELQIQSKMASAVAKADPSVNAYRHDAEEFLRNIVTNEIPQAAGLDAEDLVLLKEVVANPQTEEQRRKEYDDFRQDTYQSMKEKDYFGDFVTRNNEHAAACSRRRRLGASSRRLPGGAGRCRLFSDVERFTDRNAGSVSTADPALLEQIDQSRLKHEEEKRRLNKYNSDIDVHRTTIRDDQTVIDMNIQSALQGLATELSYSDELLGKQEDIYDKEMNALRIIIEGQPKPWDTATQNIYDDAIRRKDEIENVIRPLKEVAESRLAKTLQSKENVQINIATEYDNFLSYEKRAYFFSNDQIEAELNLVHVDDKERPKKVREYKAEQKRRMVIAEQTIEDHKKFYERLQATEDDCRAAIAGDAESLSRVNGYEQFVDQYNKDTDAGADVRIEKYREDMKTVERMTKKIEKIAGVGDDFDAYLIKQDNKLRLGGGIIAENGDRMAFDKKFFKHALRRFRHGRDSLKRGSYVALSELKILSMSDANRERHSYALANGRHLDRRDNKAPVRNFFDIALLPGVPSSVIDFDKSLRRAKNSERYLRNQDKFITDKKSKIQLLNSELKSKDVSTWTAEQKRTALIYVLQAEIKNFAHVGPEGPPNSLTRARARVAQAYEHMAGEKGQMELKSNKKIRQKREVTDSRNEYERAAT